MSVSRFGNSSDESTSSIDKKYVDQKFMTLSTNLALKVDKNGDTICGDLNILLGENDLRTFGISDIGDRKSVSLLLGDIDNQIRHNWGHPIRFIANHGIKFMCPAGEVCHFGGKTNSKAQFLRDIVMNDNGITNLRNPNVGQDAATKNYVDTRWIKSSVGYVPNLSSNINNKNGFIVSASSELYTTKAYYVFNHRADADWVPANNTNFWIQIKCPEPVRIYKIKLRGLKLRNSDGIINEKYLFNWKWQGSNDGTDWININEFDDTMIGYDFFDVPLYCSVAYSHYRIFVNKAETDNPGLSYWQLYTADPISIV